MIDHLKKGDMAREAERMLDDVGWLPEPLRTPPVPDASPVEAVEATDEAMSGGAGPNPPEDLDDPDYAIAAE